MLPPPETPPVTAARELLGETYLSSNAENLKFLGKQQKRDHWAVYFSCTLEYGALRAMCSHHKENEGEVPKFFTNESFRALLAKGQFLMIHLRKLQDFGELQGF